MEGSLELVLANHSDSGRKTDRKDAVWIAPLLRCGLIEASFVPPEDIRDLRDLTGIVGSWLTT
ncbi:IS110 family transposase [Paenibacillus popilliae]|uniref:IS110 family transposase n=1 Tax=Paenibacillus popilliae TaxID=78057 RepID=UPI0002F051BB|nr:transposase [Paenibacillus popilliae]